VNIKINNLFSSKVDIIENESFQNNIFNFNQIAKDINLQQKWDEKKSFEIEIHKSFLRGYIRETYDFKKYISSILNRSTLYQELQNNIFYITKPYPIIHLPNDLNESSNSNDMHTDQMGNYPMITLWIPLTNYDYDALSYTFGGRFINKITNKLNKKVKSIFEKNIRVNINQAIVWNGHLPHRGNLNTSNSIVAAAVFWLTKERCHDSKSVNLNNLLNVENKIDSENIDHIKLIKKYKEIVNQTCLVKNKEELKTINKSIEDQLKENTDVEKNIVCFALCLLAQRFENKDNYEQVVRNLHYISSNIGDENLHSIKYLKSKNF
jgi:hypothetical protein